MKVLQIDASARREGSISREWTERLVQKLADLHGDLEVMRRDLEQGLPLLNDELVRAYQTPDDKKSEEQRALLSLSEELIAELSSADAVVIGVPIYNFGAPAVLKAYIDLVARARKTFRYTENGPVGILEDRPVYVVVASGGTQMSSDIDFLTPHLKHVLGFMGLHDVHFLDLSRLMFGKEEKLEAAKQQIEAWFAQEPQAQNNKLAKAA